MQNVGIGDVVFIILILGVIHGILHLVKSLKKQGPPSEKNPGDK